MLLLVEGFWDCGGIEGEERMEKLVEKSSKKEEGTDM